MRTFRTPVTAFVEGRGSLDEGLFTVVLAGAPFRGILLIALGALRLELRLLDGAGDDVGMIGCGGRFKTGASGKVGT